MANLVIDASLAAAWCFPDESTDFTIAALKAVSQQPAFAPRLWAYEVRNSVLMGVRRGRISETHAAAFLRSIHDLDFHLTDPVSYDEVFQLGKTYTLAFYDAAYLDLAMREGAVLASLDDALCKAAVKAGVVLFEPRSGAAELPES